jgi:hypothetical protein
VKTSQASAKTGKTRGHQGSTASMLSSLQSAVLAGAARRKLAKGISVQRNLRKPAANFIAGKMV